MSRLDLTGKVAIITGGAAGIGKVIATALAEEGVRLTIADIDARVAGSTVQQLEQVNPAATYIPIETDVTDAQSVAAMAAGNDLISELHTFYIARIVTGALIYFIFSIVGAVKARKGIFYYFVFFGKVAYHQVYRIRPEYGRSAPENRPPSY